MDLNCQVYRHSVIITGYPRTPQSKATFKVEPKYLNRVYICIASPQPPYKSPFVFGYSFLDGNIDIPPHPPRILFVFVLLVYFL
jgi:hypothetical protein